MIDPIPFSIIFPCYVPMMNEHEPCTCTSNGNQCVLLATDEDILNNIFQTAFSHLEIQLRRKIENGEELLDWLKEISLATYNGQPIEWVLIDPRDDNVNMIGNIRELIQRIESASL